MAELLLELFSEEIPARMQARAAAQLKERLEQNLTSCGLTWSDSETHAGPRRLTAVLQGVPKMVAPDLRERRGPRLGAPEAAIAGFLRSAGLASIEEAQIREDKKGSYYLAVTEIPGMATSELLKSLLPELLQAFDWPKSMRWGDGSFRWIRPLRRILCLFGGEPVEFELSGLPGLKSGDQTEGHRVMGKGVFAVSNFADYEQKLRDNHVLLRAEGRRAKILEKARELCKAEHLELVEDEALLDELVGLSEWPVPLMGRMDEDFLRLPELIRIEVMRVHQKYLAVRNRQVEGKLSSRFIIVADLETEDEGDAITRGNERVLSARLSDARFFWEQDCQTRLEDCFDKLDGLVFYQSKGGVKALDNKIKECLGKEPQGEKDRIENQIRLGIPLVFVSMKTKSQTLVYISALLARHFSPFAADTEEKKENFIEQVKRAAKLSKCDLVTQTVIEFPALQGEVGRLLAKKQGEPDDVAAAIAEQYHPIEASDRFFNNLVSVYVALADKIVTLAGLWAAGERVTGGGDPYGMRRAALGIVHILSSTPLWKDLTLRPKGGRRAGIGEWDPEKEPPSLEDLLVEGASLYMLKEVITEEGKAVSGLALSRDQSNLIAFIAERFKIWRSERKANPLRRDFLEAVWCDLDSLQQINYKAWMLQVFFDNAQQAEACASLVAAYKRADNILGKEKVSATDPIDPSLLKESAEQALFEAAKECRDKLDAAKDTVAALLNLAELHSPLDDFFDHVMVNVENEALRRNRLALLFFLREQMRRVADFSKISL